MRERILRAQYCAAGRVVCKHAEHVGSIRHMFLLMENDLMFVNTSSPKGTHDLARAVGSSSNIPAVVALVADGIDRVIGVVILARRGEVLAEHCAHL